MLIFILVLVSLLLIWLPWLWRYQLRPYFAKTDLLKDLRAHPDSEHLCQVATLLDALYKNVYSYRVSTKERARLGYQDDAFIYGEINFVSFILLLDKIKPLPGQVFYDLGSGSGKAVFTAALCYDLRKASGVELLPALCKLAKLQINKSKTLVQLSDKDRVTTYMHRVSSIEFINDNFLHYDFSDGDLIFINATCLSYSTWAILVKKLMMLKVGSRIMTTTKKIENEAFELVYQNRELMSWGLNTVYIYRKIS